jgi:uncharacterized protein YjbI with pentapeptide repeats
MRIALLLAMSLFGVALCGADSGKAPNLPRFCAGCSFQGAQMAGADFTKVTYIGSNFENGDFRGASFRGATLVAANFERANLHGASFDGASCTACNFGHTALDGATFAGVRMTAANFGESTGSLDNAALRGLLGGCVACNFGKLDLAGRDLSGLSLVSVDFSNADLRGTNFNGAVLCWYNTVQSKQTIVCDPMAGAQVDGADFRNVQLCENPMERQLCVAADAATLRYYTGSPLTGARLP